MPSAKHQRAAAHVAQRGRRRPRLSARGRAKRKCAGQRKVIEVVAGGLGERPALPPAGHAAIHETRVALEANAGAEAVALHDARAKAFDQRVSRSDQSQRGLYACRLLEVERDRSLAAIEQGVWAEVEERHATRLLIRNLAIDDEYVGAEVGEHHRGKRRWADSRKFDNSYTLQRTHI